MGHTGSVLGPAPTPELALTQEELNSKLIEIVMSSSDDDVNDQIVDLILRGAEVNATDGNGWTALAYAAMDGQDTVVQTLINHGANVHDTYLEGMTALMYAATNGHATTIQTLINNGADVNVVNQHRWTALLCAAEAGHTTSVATLAKNGADVNVIDKGGWPALTYAAINGHASTVRTLIENGANVNNILVNAATEGNEKIVQILVESGADVDMRDEYQQTLLMITAEKGHDNVAQILIKNGADINAADDTGWNALMIAAYTDNTSLVQILLEKGVDINATSLENKTAMMIAADQGHQYIFQSLSAAHSSALEQEELNSQLLETIKGPITDNNKKIVQTLIDNGADLTSLPQDNIIKAIEYIDSPKTLSLLTITLPKGDVRNMIMEKLPATKSILKQEFLYSETIDNHVRFDVGGTPETDKYSARRINKSANREYPAEAQFKGKSDILKAELRAREKAKTNRLEIENPDRESNSPSPSNIISATALSPEINSRNTQR